MSNIEVNIKKWVKMIQTEKLEGIAEDIQESILEKPDEKLNKHIFKLLLYLSHTADKCDKQKCAIGENIYKLTSLLCSTLTEIPDSIKFVSSLFHIIRCLLTMQLYEKASKINFYLKSEALYCPRANVTDILVKIAHLWSHVVNNILVIVQKNPSSAKDYFKLKEIVKYEFEMIQIAHENYIKHLLMKISSYMDKIASISRESYTYFADFYKFIIEYLDRRQMSIKTDEKYVIYRYMLHIISRIMCENIKDSYMQSVADILDTIGSYFKKILKEDKECYLCFQQYESMCLTFIKPVECLDYNSAKSIKDNTENYVKIARKYGYAGAIKWTTLSIVQVLEDLLTYWETCIKAGKNVFLKNDTLLETMNLVVHISIFFIKQVSDRCRSCQDANCMIRRDIYNAVVIKTRCVNLVSKLSTNDLSKDICMLARKFLEQNIASVYEIKQCGCKCWMHLWCTNGALIYNLGITSESFYEEAALLFSLLCTSVIQFEGVQSKSQYISLQNPLCSSLHRLSNVHYNRGMYREAMTATALNGLLSYNNADSKAFRMWANIKHKCSTSKKIMEMTMLACLRADKTKIEELGLCIELAKYDLLKICLREARGLQEAKVNLSCAIWIVLDEMKVLKATPVECARVVQMLVYHLLNFEHDEDISKCLKQTISDLRQIKTNTFLLCLEANLEFCIFINQLHAVSKQTRVEMENTKYALYAPRLPEIGENESRDVVPAYTMINVKEDSRLMMCLQKALKKWKECFKQDIKEVVKDYDAVITLRLLITAGEYSRLYRYQECEVNIWKLAYRLASELEDHYAIIYVTGRSISLRQINHKWITVAKELAVKHKDTNNEDIIYAIAIFWISLSDFYFQCGMYSEAINLLDEARKLPGISFLSNVAVYLYSLDRILCNCSLYKECIKHEEYTRYIVETLYTMVNLNEELTMRKWKPQDKYLFGYDVLFSTTVNLSLRMNSLLSFREIGAHLVRRLKVAQALAATIRVAEILKSLCYIDLSRSQLNDCEVKLQGLEHILNIETFQLSMYTQLPKVVLESVMITPTRIVDPIRDVPQNDTSPVLKNKVFDLPEFLCHTNCDCYACQNVSYQYLVFASTHIRAQLYVLQRHFTAALQHFHGAFQIKEKLMASEKQSKKDLQKHKNTEFSWQERYYVIDYVQLLLNFYYFLRSDRSTKYEKAVNILLLAIRICEMYKLEHHPIYMSVKELMLNNLFQRTFDNLDYSSFTVPKSSDIDISKYEQECKAEQNICSTPTANNSRPKKPLTLRRNRTPPLLKLTKVTMNFSDDEDSIASSPPVGYKRTRSHSKLARRKILDVEYSDSSSTTKQETIQSNCKSLINELINTKKESLENISVKDMIIKIAPVVPDVSEHLYKFANDLDVPVTNENVQKLIEMVENLKTNANSEKKEKSVRKTRHSKQSNLNDYNKKISQVVELFKDMAVNEVKDNFNIPNKNDLLLECTESVSSIKTDISKVQKQCSTSEESNTKRLDQCASSVNQCNIDSLKKTQISETTRGRTRKTYAGRTITSKDTQSVKTRKSKEKPL